MLPFCSSTHLGTIKLQFVHRLIGISILGVPLPTYLCLVFSFNFLCFTTTFRPNWGPCSGAVVECGDCRQCYFGVPREPKLRSDRIGEIVKRGWSRICVATRADESCLFDQQCCPCLVPILMRSLNMCFCGLSTRK